MMTRRRGHRPPAHPPTEVPLSTTTAEGVQPAHAALHMRKLNDNAHMPQTICFETFNASKPYKPTNMMTVTCLELGSVLCTRDSLAFSRESFLQRDRLFSPVSDSFTSLSLARSLSFCSLLARRSAFLMRVTVEVAVE